MRDVEKGKETQRDRNYVNCERTVTHTHTDTETAKQTEISDQSGNCRFLNFDGDGAFRTHCVQNVKRNVRPTFLHHISLERKLKMLCNGYFVKQITENWNWNNCKPDEINVFLRRDLGTFKPPFCDVNTRWCCIASRIIENVMSEAAKSSRSSATGFICELT